MLDPDWQLPMVNGLKLRCASDRKGEEEPNVVASQADSEDADRATPCANSREPRLVAEHRNSALPSSNILTLNVGPTQTSECTSSENPDSAPSGINGAGSDRAVPCKSKELSKWPQLGIERADPSQDTPRSSRGASRLAAPGTNKGNSSCAKPMTGGSRPTLTDVLTNSGLSMRDIPNADREKPICKHPTKNRRSPRQLCPRDNRSRPGLAGSNANSEEPTQATLRRDNDKSNTAKDKADDTKPAHTKPCSNDKRPRSHSPRADAFIPEQELPKIDKLELIRARACSSADRPRFARLSARSKEPMQAAPCKNKSDPGPSAEHSGKAQPSSSMLTLSDESDQTDDRTGRNRPSCARPRADAAGPG